MKYTHDIVIDLPIETVFSLMDNEENMYKWQKGLVKHEHLSGEKGEVGAKTKLYFEMGRRKMDMVETILKKDTPNKIDLSFEAKNVMNYNSSSFQDIDGKSTKWTVDNEFQFSGFMKVMAFFMSGAFKKQSLCYMEDFKKFAEESAKN